MKITFLRLIILMQLIVAGLALFNAHGYLDLQTIPAVEIKTSPDAMYHIRNCLTSWWFFKGACCGLSICLGLVAFDQRAIIINGDWKLKAHWVVPAFSIIFVLWYGRNI